MRSIGETASSGAGPAGFLQNEIDIWQFEPGDGHVKINDDLAEMLQFDRQDLLIPARTGGELVVGQHIGSLLILAKVCDLDRGHFGQAEPLPLRLVDQPRQSPFSFRL